MEYLIAEQLAILIVVVPWDVTVVGGDQVTLLEDALDSRKICRVGTREQLLLMFEHAYIRDNCSLTENWDQSVVSSNINIFGVLTLLFDYGNCYKSYE